LFSDVAAQEHIVRVITRQIADGNLNHAYLFSGPRGVGKTTIARLMAKSLNCDNRKEGDFEPCGKCGACEEATLGRAVDTIEIDAASHTGVDHVREHIIEAARYAPQRKKKVFIIDEVHMLSKSAFNALLKTLEEPPEHVHFILATTELQKIPDTVVSRCQRLAFLRIPADKMRERITEIAKSEKKQVDDDVIDVVISKSEGCLRDAESLLGQLLAISDKKVTLEEVKAILPLVDDAFLAELLKAGVDCHELEVKKLLEEYTDRSSDIDLLIDELIQFTRAVYHGEKQAEVERGALMPVIISLLEAKELPRFDIVPQLPLELALMKHCNAAVAAPAAPPRAEPAPPASRPQLKPESAPAPEPRPTAVQAEPVSDQQLAAEDAGVPKDLHHISEESDVAIVASSASGIVTVDEIRSKWRRCVEAVSKRSMSLPLVLGDAVPQDIEGDIVKVAFNHRFHFEAISKPKNVGILSEAMSEILQREVRVEPVFEAPEEEKQLNNLAANFGGQVM
jgi:DNA polymerase-3 subunit gamma/tau